VWSALEQVGHRVRREREHATQEPAREREDAGLQRVVHREQQLRGADANLRRLVDRGPVALIEMNTRVDARDVLPTTVIEDIELIQAQVRPFAEAQLAPAWSRLAPTTARPPARRAEAVRPRPPS
jgi:hypothetical protein